MLRAVTALLALSTLNVCGQTADVISYTEPFRDIKISSAEPGVVQEVLVQEGQLVKSGDVLVKLDARVLQQEAKMAREEYKLKAKRVEKLRQLLLSRHASEDEVERAESDLVITEIKADRVEAQIERLTLRSPIDGIITEMRFDVAESVPGANSHVATVVQLDPLRVQFNLQAADARMLKAGEQIPLFFPETNETRQGQVEFVSPVATAVVNTVRVKVIVPAEDEKITAGARCIYRAPILPASAVTQASSQPKQHE